MLSPKLLSKEGQRRGVEDNQSLNCCEISQDVVVDGVWHHPAKFRTISVPTGAGKFIVIIGYFDVASNCYIAVTIFLLPLNLSGRKSNVVSFRAAGFAGVSLGGMPIRCGKQISETALHNVPAWISIISYWLMVTHYMDICLICACSWQKCMGQIMGRCGMHNCFNHASAFCTNKIVKNIDE